jgi:hypothetical protein
MLIEILIVAVVAVVALAISTPTSTMLADTINFRGKDLIDQIFSADPMLAFLNERKALSPWTEGGEEIENILETDDNPTFEARDYKSVIPFEEVDPLETVALPRRIINGGIVWYVAQEEANASSETRIRSFTKDLLSNGEKSMKRVMGAEAWQDGTVNHLHGISAIMSASNIYMGIDRSATGAEFWRARTGATFTDTSSGVSVVFGPFNTAEPLVEYGGTDGGFGYLYDQLCDDGGTDGPDFGFTTLALYNKVRALIGAERIRTNERMAKIGYPENFQYRGSTFVWTRRATAGQFGFLNSNYVKLRPYGTYAKKLRITDPEYLLSRGLDAYAVMMQWEGNLSCTKPARVGMFTGKTV